jgi:hypothetical protein
MDPGQAGLWNSGQKKIIGVRITVDTISNLRMLMCSVEVPKFFAPVTNLLLPMDQRTTWKGMRTVAEIKREKNIKVNYWIYPSRYYAL